MSREPMSLEIAGMAAAWAEMKRQFGETAVNRLRIEKGTEKLRESIFAIVRNVHAAEMAFLRNEAREFDGDDDIGDDIPF